ncbi:MAG: MgtC/SapB family protein [Clostridia bacterium]|nr:MgtC/SapB family protein [Clostridia bacterium]
MDFLGFFTSSLALDTVTKLSIALILSAIIGLERELVHKPAGIKTHTLICISATLVMSLGMYMRNIYPEIVLDPTRLPAQILAGIGFVGAGTIIREGLSVKGITTAASLLSITCVGLAVGAGFYEGAIIATLLIFVILYFTSPIQNAISKKSKLTTFTLISRNEYGTISKAQELFERNKLDVISIKQIKSNSSNSLIIKFLVKCSDVTNKEALIQELTKIEGITEVNLSRGLAKVDVDAD